MRDNYLKEKNLYELCRCGYVLRADDDPGLVRERRRHDKRCLLVTSPKHWSVLALSN
jgi:hypothetical protein